MLRKALRRGRSGAVADRPAGPGATAVRAPSGPQLGPREAKKRRPNPLVVVGGAFALGAVLAKAIDWRGHAHPRR